jgi:hypothetical protein
MNELCSYSSRSLLKASPEYPLVFMFSHSLSLAIKYFALELNYRLFSIISGLFICHIEPV